MKNYISPEMKISLFSVEIIATNEPLGQALGTTTNLTPNIEGVVGENAVRRSYNIKNAIELK